MHARKVFRLAALLVAGSFPFVPATAAQTTDTVVVPFVYHDNRMLIRSEIDGRGPFWLIVDTGDPGFDITPETARKLLLNVRNYTKVSGAGSASVEAGATSLQSVAIGSMRLKDVNATVLDLTTIQRKFHFEHLDGVLGYSVLKDYATFVNVDAGTIAFAKSPPAEPASAKTVPFTGVLPIVGANIDGIDTRALIDTGDRSSLTLLTKFAQRYGFYGRYASQKDIITGYGIGGPIYADVFTLPVLTALGSQVHNVVTRASRMTSGGFANFDLGASIGTGVLKRFNIVYDYPRKTITAWPSKYFSKPDRFVPPGT